MKILYITANQRNDFMSDTVFHGLKSLFGDDVIDLNPIWYMYNTVDKPSLINQLHGRGFTLAGTIQSSEVDRTDIDHKIKNNHFDLIVYGAIYRCLDKLELVLKHYPKNKIIFIDGDDVTDIQTPEPITQFPSACLDRYSIHIQQPSIVDKGLYFKRELTVDYARRYPYIFPITFGIPAEKIVNSNSIEKSKLLATNRPGSVDTLVFYTEHDYYQDYQQSLFGLTWKKAGWDCLRHYEIMANGCIPLFLDIKQCPSTCLFNFPKLTLVECWKSIKNVDLNKLTDIIFEYDNGKINNFDMRVFDNLDVDDDIRSINEVSVFGEEL